VFEISPTTRQIHDNDSKIMSPPSTRRYHHRPKEPGSWTTKQCTTNLEVSYVRFSGSLSAKLIQVR
jgi:hypothetical protein